LCILYQDDVFFQYYLFKVLLIKDILTIKNESWEKNKYSSYLRCSRWDGCFGLKIFLCILYNNVVFFQYYLSKVLLIKDILTIKNKSWEKNKYSSWLRCPRWDGCFGLKIFLCILYQDDVFFQYYLFKVLLIKDILTIKNESWEKNKYPS